MRVIDLGGRSLADGVLASPAGESGRIILWVPRDDDPRRRTWDRIGVAAGESGWIERGIRIAPATAYRVEGRRGGGLIQTLASLLRRGPDSTWTLPDGTPVERRGGRRVGLALAWRDQGSPLSEPEAQSLWPNSRVKQIGDGLFLAEGPAVPRRDPGAAEAPASPRDPASGDRGGSVRPGDLRARAVAIVDQGVADLNQGDAVAAAERFRQAAVVFRDLGDPTHEADALYNLGLTLLGLGRPREASPALDQAVRLSRSSGDRLTLKLALEGIALMRAGSGDAAGALAALDEALEAARAVGDRHQEARLIWWKGVAFSDLGLRDHALREAEGSAALMRSLGRPEAAWFEEHLRRYREEAAASPRVLAAGDEPPAAAPGPLRMAFTAAKAMAAFLGSGLKTTPEDVRRARLSACSLCEHHTGRRCRVCGCFTEAKSRMAHERCPLNKWPG